MKAILDISKGNHKVVQLERSPEVTAVGVVSTSGSSMNALSPGPQSCACGGGCPRCVSMQAKLKVNLPGDHYEQEADRIADQVMRMPAPAVQRAPT